MEIRKRGLAYEILWTKDGRAREMDLVTFAAECGLFDQRTEKSKKGPGKTVAVGFDSASTVFYRLKVPSVKEKELGAIVRLQAESRLPLAPEQMELTWRSGELEDGQVDVTVAAARREQLLKFVQVVRGVEPTKILLDCEGTVKVWREFFSRGEEAAIVVNVRSRNTQVCLAERAQLVNAVSLDMGVDDLLAEGKPEEQVETTERFVQDMRSVLNLFGGIDISGLPVHVLSDGHSAIGELVSSLESAGLSAQVVMPQTERLAEGSELTAEDVYEYRVPIGLALLAIEADGEELNIFKHLYQPATEEEKIRWLQSPKVAGTIVAVMLALLVTVFYAVDVVHDKRLSRLVEKVNVEEFAGRQKLIRAVEQRRPDLLELLTLINSTEHDGIVLSTIHFKKGQPVALKGEANNADNLYKFQKSLREK
ncbi:MAG: hypothetical protein JSV16_15050 [Candidatus Hydrogenedentota bacterium]|nr:MAG: hypothetical protein JSV16_15050 [Candidatus Hydrogenedentota bacterium]